jgi:hypothetical protein
MSGNGKVRRYCIVSFFRLCQGFGSDGGDAATQAIGTVLFLAASTATVCKTKQGKNRNDEIVHKIPRAALGAAHTPAAMQNIPS